MNTKKIIIALSALLMFTGCQKSSEKALPISETTSVSTDVIVEDDSNDNDNDDGKTLPTSETATVSTDVIVEDDSNDNDNDDGEILPTSETTPVSTNVIVEDDSNDNDDNSDDEDDVVLKDEVFTKSDNISDGINNLTQQMLSYNNDEYSSKIVSGYSAYSILTKILPYASGDTESQIQAVIGDISSEDFVNQTDVYLKQSNPEEKKNTDEGELFFFSDRPDDYVLETSNLFLIDDNCKLNATPRDNFVFEDLQSDNIVSFVNNYVSEKTHNLISQLISEPFDTLTKAAIIDTLYFKGQWQNQFTEEVTEKATFYGKSKETKVDMMAQKNYFSQYENIIRLPYNSNSDYHIVMDIVKDIDDIESAFKYYNENKHQLDPEYSNGKEIILKMPKFENEITMSLNDIYKSLGITTLFEPGQCDLSKLADDLYISDAIQKAKIIVDEEGTEAAAVTMMISKTTSMRDEVIPPEFIVDKPFMYVIKVQETDDILFAGYYYDFE